MMEEFGFGLRICMEVRDGQFSILEENIVMHTLEEE